MAGARGASELARMIFYMSMAGVGTFIAIVFLFIL